MDDALKSQAIDIAIRHFDGKKTAYDSEYLGKATNSLGFACNTGVNGYGHPLVLWFGMFANCHFGDKFASGDIWLFSSNGFSSVMLAYQVEKLYCGIPMHILPNNMWNKKSQKTLEYDFGVYACLLQWGLNVKFSELIRRIPALEMLNLVREYEEHDFEWLVRESTNRWQDRCETHAGPPWPAILDKNIDLNDRDRDRAREDDNE